MLLLPKPLHLAQALSGSLPMIDTVVMHELRQALQRDQQDPRFRSKRRHALHNSHVHLHHGRDSCVGQ
jgi:hypothetical protein